MIECLIITAFSIALYYKTIDFEVIMDDYQWFRVRQALGLFPFKKIRNLRHFIQFIDDHFYSGTTFGTNVKVEHCFKIFLYTTTCLLIYWDFGHNSISFWAAMLYACNPINNQTSMWLNGRRYSVNIILVLLMMVFPMASPILYLFTGLLQVTAFFSPVLLTGHSFWYLCLMPLFLAAGWPRIISKCKERASGMAAGDLKTFQITRFIVIVKTFGFFFYKMLIPGVCAMQYPDRLKWGLIKEGTEDAYKIDKDFITGIGGLLCCLCIAIFLPHNYLPYIGFFTLSTLQWSAVLPITQILSDRYCSLPNIFMMFFVSYFTHFAGIFYIPIMIMICTYYCVCLSIIFPMYKNLTDFYDYHLKYFPHLSWYRHNLIKDLMNEGKFDMASAQTFHGLIHDKTDFRLLIWGSIMAMMKGDFNNAEEFLKEAEKNTYINRHKENMAEIEDIRKQIKSLIPIQKKKERLTPREQVFFINRRNRRV